MIFFQSGSLSAGQKSTKQLSINILPAYNPAVFLNSYNREILGKSLTGPVLKSTN